MKNTKTNTSYPQISVDIGELSLNIFRVGKSPLIKAFDGPPNHHHIRATHTHFTYEIFFVTSGSLKLVTTNSIMEYKSSVLIIPPKTKHVSVPTGGESYCLLFSFNGNPSIAEQLNQGICELPMNEEIAFYIKKFTESTLENTYSSTVNVKHLAALIFNNVFNNLSSTDLKICNNKKHASQHINAIETYINSHITNSTSKKLALADVAKNVYLSPKQVSRIIVNEYGCTFSNLITEKRLVVAEAMLKNTDVKVSEIANQTFFGSEKYFYRVFKSKYGMSPLKYRKEIRILEK